jgi:hypothetical protein
MDGGREIKKENELVESCLLQDDVLSERITAEF